MRETIKYYALFTDNVSYDDYSIFHGDNSQKKSKTAFYLSILIPIFQLFVFVRLEFWYLKRACWNNLSLRVQIIYLLSSPLELSS